MTSETPNTPKRYDLITNYRAGSSIEEMERSDDGEWVRYEDIEAVLAALHAERAGLVEALTAADMFISNGIELGFIRMPDADCPDPAKRVPLMIKSTLAAFPVLPSPEGPAAARCDERYPVPQTSPARNEPFEATYRCGLVKGHAGPHGG